MPRRALVPVVLWLFLFGLYHLNPTPLSGNDTAPARYAAVSLAKRGDLDLNEFVEPMQGSSGSADGDASGARDGVQHDPARGSPRSDLPYFMQRGLNGRIISRFGAGTPIAAAPFFWVAFSLDDDGKMDRKAAMYLAKTVSATYVALSATLIYSTALSLGATMLSAVCTALVFGLGTSMFSVVSQALWQHGPATFFFCVGLWCLLRARHASVVGSGAAFAAMVVCRPPMAVFALTAFVYVFVRHRRWAPAFSLAALPIALWQGYYNQTYIGSPWLFSQMLRVEGADALPHANYWQASWANGLTGLLVSPSRGLLVYSPVFLFLFWRPRGLWRAQAPVLRGFLVATLVYAIMLARYYGWYGGWTYGYRMLVDAVPVWCLALVPVMSWLRTNQSARTLFGIALAISIAIHAVGAYVYDPYAWDARPDIDFHLERLWHVRDGQLSYWFSHLAWRRLP